MKTSKNVLARLAAMLEGLDAWYLKDDRVIVVTNVFLGRAWSLDGLSEVARLLDVPLPHLRVMYDRSDGDYEIHLWEEE